MGSKSDTMATPVTLSTLVSVLTLINIVAITTSFGKIDPRINSFSVSALQYLLENKDYVRFDWYVQRYLKQHPDSSVLYLLNGYRYFDQTFDSRSSKAIRINEKTGGIPRKYPENFVRNAPFNDTRIQFIYNNKLLKKAFESIQKARSRPVGTSDKKMCYIDKIEALILNTFNSDGTSIDDELKIKILQALLRCNPDNSTIESELGKYHFTAGNLDSSSYYTLKAFTRDSINLKTLNNAIVLASIKGNFKEASDLSGLKFDISGKQIDLEQSVVYTLTYDSSYAYSIQCRVEALDYYSNSHSISSWLFRKHSDTAKIPDKKYFSGDLFHLNLPLLSINYKRDRDKIAYYADKACIFFVYSVYDSAAYYNLNLLRSIKKDNRLGYAALFNLAAEYYAAGEYRLSYSRFLDLFKYYNGEQDCAVRYGLGVNYEAFGDYSNAIKQYSYVLHNTDDHYNGKYNLQDLAAYRLKRLYGIEKNYVK